MANSIFQDIIDQSFPIKNPNIPLVDVVYNYIPFLFSLIHDITHQSQRSQLLYHPLEIEF